MSGDAGPGSPRGRVWFAYDWTFRNRKTGRITVAQLPNLSLGIFLVASIVRRYAHLTDTPRTVVDVAAAVSLTWWAIDEVIRGVNPWRRVLGASALTAELVGAVAR